MTLPVSGRTDGYTKAICQDGGVPGIYEMTLCKTEKSQATADPVARAMVPSNRDSYRRIHPDTYIAGSHISFWEKIGEDSVPSCCLRTFASIGILTDRLPHRIRKSCRFLLYWGQWITGRKRHGS